MEIIIFLVKLLTPHHTSIIMTFYLFITYSSGLIFNPEIESGTLEYREEIISQMLQKGDFSDTTVNRFVQRVNCAKVIVPIVTPYICNQ